MATMMHDRLDVLPHIVEAILNHVSGHKAGVAGVYNRAKYIEPMRAALGKWANYIDGITGTVPAATISEASTLRLVHHG
jgi:hypothetical protein